MSTTKKLEEQLLETTVQPTVEPAMQQTQQQTQVQPTQQQTQVQPTQQTPAQPAQQTSTQQTTTQPAQQNANADVNALLNMHGVSDSTKQALGSLVTNGYKPSQQVTDALNNLQSIISQQPAGFQSAHMNNLNNILNSIMGRKTFSYDMSNDPFYNNYKQMYINAGKQAMSDTVGQMSALTGGYGNSYAATAGQQQYNEYLQKLHDRIPELQQMAMDQYNLEGQQLMDQYNLTSDAYNREYGEYQDQYDRWLAERDYAQGQYETERGYDYDAYNNNVGNWMNIADMEMAQGNADRAYYYDWAMAMIENGQIPSTETLIKAGLSEEEVRSLFGGNSGGSGSGSSSKGKGSGSSTTVPGIDDAVYAATDVVNSAAQVAQKLNLNAGKNLVSNITTQANSGKSTPTGTGNEYSELNERFEKYYKKS